MAPSRILARAASTTDGFEITIPGGMDSPPVIYVTIICLLFSVIAVSLRFYTRIKLVGIFGKDDWFMALTLFLYSVYCGGILYFAFGTYEKTKLSLAWIETSITDLYLIEIFYVASVVTLKISLALLFLRIMLEKWHRRFVYIAVIATTLFGISYIFLAIFQCGAPTGSLNFIEKKVANHCIHPSVIIGMGYCHGILAVLTDITFVILPVLSLRGLQISKGESRTIYCILAFGAVSGITSMVRMIYVPGLAVDIMEFWSHITPLAVCSTLEVGVGIVACCLATLRRLVSKLSTSTASRRCSRFARRFGGGPSFRPRHADELLPTISEPETVMSRGQAWSPPRCNAKASLFESRNRSCNDTAMTDCTLVSVVDIPSVGVLGQYKPPSTPIPS